MPGAIRTNKAADKKRTEFVIVLYWVEPLPTEPAQPAGEEPVDGAMMGDMMGPGGMMPGGMGGPGMMPGGMMPGGPGFTGSPDGR
jgi:hypothetical protein